MDEFPYGNQLKHLPLRALVAFASRCARRVQHLYILEDDHPTKQSCTAAVDAAIRIAEEFAMGGAVREKKTVDAERDAVEAVRAARESGNLGPGVAYAANAAYAAVNAAITAMAKQRNVPIEVHTVLDSVEIAGIAALAANSDDAATKTAISNDIGILKKSRLGRFPELGKPIDPMEDGPLGALVTGNHPETHGEKSSKKQKAKATATSPGGSRVANMPKRSSTDSGGDRTKRALQRIDALQHQFEGSRDDAVAIDRGAKHGPTPKGGKRAHQPAAHSHAADPSINELQQRLQQELERVVAAKDSLEKERLRLQEERKATVSGQRTAGRDGHRKSTAALRQETKKLRARNEDLQQQFKAARDALAEEQEQLAEEQEELESDREELNQQREEFAEEVKQFTEQEQAFRKASRKLKKETEKLKREKLKLESQQEPLQARLRTLQKEHDQLQTDQAELEAELESHREEIAQLQQLKSIDGKNDQLTAGKSKENTATDHDAEKEIQQLLDERDALKEQVVSLQQERTAIEETQNQLLNRAKCFQENETALEQALKDLTRERELLESEKSAFEEEHRALEADRQKFQHEKNRFDDLIEVTFRR